MGSSPFYIHEYVFSSKFLRNCDASKHIRFLKRTQAVNSTNKYTCVYRMYYGMVQICWTNSPFLFPWNTKIPMYFSSKMRWLSLFGVEGLDWTQILIWRLNFELVRVNFELILIQVFLHQNWTQTLFNPSKNLKLRIYSSRIRSNPETLVFLKPGHIYINLLLLIDMNSIWEMIFYLCNLGN